ncbi:MAG: NADH-quinone oxidoreductase subunit M [marine bacterium B5-7]|nr:MAG: NADH-quinone oxidoreductase subunit M [marine bacterium B5-7]
MGFFEQHILSILIWLPVVGGLLVLATGDDRGADIARKIGIGFSLATFVASIPLYIGFNSSTSDMQFIEHASWIDRYNIEYFLGIDGISLPLILLTTFLTVIVMFAALSSVRERVAQYVAAFLIMEGLMVGVFSALDSILFYVFWEAMLIPMYLIIGIWGGTNRVYASIKFFLYTLLGSLLMLVSFIYLYNVTGGSFSIQSFHDVPLGMTAQTLIFIAFFSAFAVKIPMFPVHTWLPDAHVEAPTGGSVILAAIMLKMGGYGFLRFSLPVTPDASANLAGFMIALSLIAVVYIALVALVQFDMKKLIAYSSISHMGFVTLGIFLFTVRGIEGAMVQMISHGFISGALFLCVGVLYDRLHSREIATYGGVVKSMPMFAAFAVLFAMANAGLPGTSAFVGEFLVIMASFDVNAWYAAVAAITLILGAAYTLWMVKRVIFGKITNAAVADLKDLNSPEFLILALLALAVLAFGIWPDPLINVMQASIDNLTVLATRSKL